MVSYPSLDTLVYLNSAANFRSPSLPTTNPAGSMSLQQRHNASATEIQNFKELFNNQINLDMFQDSATHTQSLDISSQSPTLIPSSADSRSLILSLQNQQTCSPSHTDPDNTSPTHLAQTALAVNTALGFENLPPVHPQTQIHLTHPALSQSAAFEAPSNQLSSHLVSLQDRASVTSPIPVCLKLFSSIAAPISPIVKVNHLHEEPILSSAPGSSFSKSPQTDSSTASRHTENPDHVNVDSVKPCVVSQNVSSDFSGAHRVLVPTSHCEAFRDYSATQNPQGTLGHIPKLKSNTNSSPTDLCRKAILTDTGRASTDPSSPYLNNTESSALSSAGALPPGWSHYSSMKYPLTCDVYNRRESCQSLYSAQGAMQSFPTNDRNNPAIKHTTTDQNKSIDPSPFALNKSITSPSTAGWSADEMNENHSSSIVPGNISANDNQQLFGFPPPDPPTQTSTYSNSESMEHQIKFVDQHCAPSRNPSHNNSLGFLPSYNPQRTPYMKKINENLGVLGEDASTGLNKLTHHPSEETGHNAVEKRYRNNINSHIAALADLVPALQHLRSLPSAATSRRHSSQFIVSTSSIGKIPTGLVDGVKAATKLSKGNILSKSVDYMRHLLRRRAELKEDIEDLKQVVKGRVEGGELLIFQWEEMVNAKSTDRQRQRMLEQNQGEEDGDEDDDMNDSHNKRTSLNVNNSLIPNKKIKLSDPKIGDTGKYKASKMTSKGTRKLSNAPELSNQPLGSIKSDSFALPSEPLPSGSNNGSYSHNVLCGRPESLSRTANELVDELEILREPPTNYHHQFLSNHHNTQDFNHLHTSEFSPDFMGNPFASVPGPETHSEQAISDSSRPLLAVFMGFSFALGSGYSYHQGWKTPRTRTEAWKSPDKSRSAEYCPLSAIPSSLHGFNCHHEAKPLQGFKCHHKSNPDGSHSLTSSTHTSRVHQSSIGQAGLNTMSIASIIWTLILIMKPEFIMNYCSSGRLKRSKEKSKFKGQIICEKFTNNSHLSIDHEGGRKETFLYKDPPCQPIQNSFQDGFDHVHIFMGCSQNPGRIQYERLCYLTSYPNNWISVTLALSKEIARITAVLLWGEKLKRIVGFYGRKREGNRGRAKKIKMTLAWMRIAEIESSWDFGRASFFRRLHSILKLYNLSRNLDWRDRVIKEQLDPGKISAILALSVKNLFGETNRVSPILWRKAMEVHQRDQTALKNVKTSPSIPPAIYYRPSFQRTVEEGWLSESLMLGYEEACELLARKGKKYKLMSAHVGEFGGNRGWSPLKQIVETRAELELVEIWSRIFVSLISKTCPVGKTSKDGCITETSFELDGGLAELPTRLEEAGAPYALQVNQGRRKVEQSIERICRLRLGSRSAVGRIARVTRGMWAMAFGKREIAVKVGEELKREGTDDEVLCIGPFLELVLRIRLVSEPRHQKVNSTLDNLAKMTINWLLVRREHILSNVMEKPPKSSATGPHENKTKLLAKCKELKSILAMAMIETENNPELNTRSIKQTDEAIQAGETREYDLPAAIEDCKTSVILIEIQSQKI